MIDIERYVKLAAEEPRLGNAAPLVPHHYHLHNTHECCMKTQYAETNLGSQVDDGLLLRAWGDYLNAMYIEFREVIENL